MKHSTNLIASLALALLTIAPTATAVDLDLRKTDDTASSLTDAARRLYASASPRALEEVDAYAEAGTCSVTPIACNTTQSGSLGFGDCTLDSDGTYLDIWTFSGTAGQTVTITMRSAAFDSYLVLGDPSGAIVKQDNNSAGGLDARITYTLTTSGTWGIITNQMSPASGSYTLNLQCEGGGGGDDCTPQVRQLSCGQTVTGTIDGLDCDVEGLLVEFWTFTGSAGQTFTAAMTRTGGTGDVGLVVFHDDGTDLGNDLSGGSTATVSGTLPKAGTWVIAALASGNVTYSLATSCQVQSSCVQTTTTACMLGNRFRVSVRYRNAFDNGTVNTDALRKPVTGFANPAYETAFFYFNSADNIEAMVKMLDQGNTDAAGQPTIAVLTGTATPLRIEVTIVDTKTGATRRYTSEFAKQAGITDFTAFLK